MERDDQHEKPEDGVMLDVNISGTMESGPNVISFDVKFKNPPEKVFGVDNQTSEKSCSNDKKENPNKPCYINNFFLYENGKQIEFDFKLVMETIRNIVVLSGFALIVSYPIKCNYVNSSLPFDLPYWSVGVPLAWFSAAIALILICRLFCLALKENINKERITFKQIIAFIILLVMLGVGVVSVFYIFNASSVSNTFSCKSTNFKDQNTGKVVPHGPINAK